MRQERDADGRLIYADRSNFGDALDDLIGGRKRAVPGVHSTGTTPPHDTNTIENQHRLTVGYSTPTGRMRV